MSDKLPKDGTLEFESSGVASPRDLQVLTVMFLLEASYRDGERDSSELSQIVLSVGRAFSLKEAETGDLLLVAEHLLRNSNGLEEFAARARERFNIAQRQEILKMVWRVILMDGIVDNREAEFSAALRRSLQLSLEQSLSARAEAEEEAQEVKQRLAAARSTESDEDEDEDGG